MSDMNRAERFLSNEGDLPAYADLTKDEQEVLLREIVQNNAEFMPADREALDLSMRLGFSFVKLLQANREMFMDALRHQSTSMSKMKSFYAEKLAEWQGEGRTPQEILEEYANDELAMYEAYNEQKSLQDAIKRYGKFHKGDLVFILSLASIGTANRQTSNGVWVRFPKGEKTKTLLFTYNDVSRLE